MLEGRQNSAPGPPGWELGVVPIKNQYVITVSEVRIQILIIPYLSAKGPLLVSKEVQPVLPLGQPRDINIVQPLQGGSTVRFIGF